jgi:selenocysteine lyase/cysteine desulfurase
MEALLDPALFALPQGVTHVCAGGQTPALHTQVEALARHAADKSAGSPGRDRMEAEVERARVRLAALWGMQTGDIGLVANVAEGMSLLVESLGWREGDNVVLDANEYPSVVAPLSLYRGPQIELRFAPMAEPAEVARRVDGHTRIVAVSAVSYLNAARHDLGQLRAAADAAGALLVVDFTQAAGWMPIHASIADFAFSACYKWMLGHTGVAVACWNRARQADWAPDSGGWYSIETGPRPDYAAPLRLRADAGRFTRGNPSHGAVYALHAALDVLDQVPAAALERHVQALTTALLARLSAAGIPSITPPDPSRHGASVCVAHPEAARLAKALEERGVLAWNGRGRVRFSFHGYNTMVDVERIMAALRAVWPG